MFRWTLLWVIPVFATMTLGAQTYSSLITDKEIYHFLNRVTRTEKKHSEEPKLERKHIYYKIALWDTGNFIKDTLTNEYPGSEFKYLFKQRYGADTLFNAADRAFLFQQYTLIKDTQWRRKFTASDMIKVIDREMPNVYFYSIPLFSANKSLAVLYIEYYCGSLCAYGGYYIFKKKGKGRWKFITSVNTWIS